MIDVNLVEDNDIITDKVGDKWEIVKACPDGAIIRDPRRSVSILCFITWAIMKECVEKLEKPKK